LFCVVHDDTLARIAFELKGQKVENEIVYTNPNYPNVKVVESSASHADHTGKFLKPAWELSQQTQTGNFKSNTESKA
jgi:hypothetical protein